MRSFRAHERRNCLCKLKGSERGGTIQSFWFSKPWLVRWSRLYITHPALYSRYSTVRFSNSSFTNSTSALPVYTRSYVTETLDQKPLSTPLPSILPFWCTALSIILTPLFLHFGNLAFVTQPKRGVRSTIVRRTFRPELLGPRCTWEYGPSYAPA